MAGPNIHQPDFEPDDREAGFLQRRARLGRQAGAERLGASLYELPPGKAAWPYHLQHANEEMLVVLSGRPSLRTPQGWRELSEGEVVAFPRGDRGAHQVLNRSDADVRMLVVSEMNAPEVSVYPDSGKVAAFAVAPGSGDEGLKALFRLADEADYWDGESPPERDGQG